jgi:cell division septal protein FtsQ
MIQEKGFFRPKQRQVNTGGETVQKCLKRGLRAAFRVLLLVLFLLAGHGVYTYLLEAPLFQVREVEVVGYRRVPKQTLLSLVPMEEMTNLFAVRLKKIAQCFESHPWIDQVRIRKVFPQKIWIQVEERRPVAILQLEELYYIDSQGVIFSPAGEGDGYNYPFLTGLTRQLMDKEAEMTRLLMMKALELLRVADKEKENPLRDISEIHLEKGYGLRCFTQQGGLEVEMGWDGFAEKLRRLAFVCSDLQKRGLSATAIDCRDSNRLVVRKSSTRMEAKRR